MLAPYVPEPFPPPFPPGHDPRGSVREVVSLDATTLRLSDSSGTFTAVPAASLERGFAPQPGTRVTLLIEATKPSLLGKLFSSQAPAQVVRVVPLRPDPLELAFTRGWVESIRASGMNVECDVEALLIERLRRAPFGTLRLQPLRRLLRAELDAAVAAQPNHFGLPGHRAQANLLLESVGAPLLEPMDARGSLEAIEALADEINRRLAGVGTPLRLVPCERELVEGLGAHDSDRDYLIDQPAWLPLVPSVARELVRREILRVHRDAKLELAPTARDPRALRLGAAPAASPAAVIPLRPTPAPIAPAPASATRLPANELHVPCRATIESFVPMDSVGKLVTENGLTVSFGRSACHGFMPEPGQQVFLIDAGPHPSGRGLRAKVVNLTGAPELDRLAAAEAENRVKNARKKAEQALREEFDLDAGVVAIEALLEMPDARRRELAARLMELKRTSHLAEHLFEELATAFPHVFHPHLDELSHANEPESLAYLGAPFTAVSHLVDVLRGATATSLRSPPQVGEVGTAKSFERRTRAPSNALAAALLALARSGAPEAVAAIDGWLATTATAVDEVDDLLIVAGWQVHARKLVRVAGPPAFRRVADASGALEIFGELESRCGSCGNPLLNLQRGGDRLPLATCPRCLAYAIDSYELHVATDGSMTTLSPAPRRDFGPLRTWDALPSRFRARLEPAPVALPNNLGIPLHTPRVGGYPTWVGYAVSRVRCPRCERPLEFAAQFPDPELDRETWSGGDWGLILAFVCAPCRVVTTILQYES